MRSVETFIDQSANILSWRLKELSHFLLHARALTGRAQEAHLRCGLVMLYAHWEGSVRELARAYLDYVSGQGLVWRRLKPHLGAAKLAAVASAGTKKPSYYLSAVEILFSATPADIPESVIQTDSNLTHSTLCEILFAVGVDSRRFDTRKVFIDETLVHSRNKIAHGEGFRPTLAEYETMHSDVVQLMRQVHAAITENVLTDAHLRTT